MFNPRKDFYAFPLPDAPKVFKVYSSSAAGDRSVTVAGATIGVADYIDPAGGAIHVVVRVAPNKRGGGVEVSDATPFGAVPARAATLALQRIQEGLADGDFAGQPMVDVVVCIIGSSLYESSAAPAAFANAAFHAARNAVRRAGVVAS